MEGRKDDVWCGGQVARQACLIWGTGWRGTLAWCEDRWRGKHNLWGPAASTRRGGACLLV
eukprot:354137-Chlamydomonas_euryale.AAC.2